MSWLEKLKAGDKVIVRSVGGNRITRVARITKTQIVVEKTKYNKTYGSIVGGGSWSQCRLEEWSGEKEYELMLLIKKQKATKMIKDTDFHNFPLSELEKIVIIIKQNK